VRGRPRVAGLAGVLAGLHVLGVALVAWQAPRHPGFVGIAVIAYTLGLRHAFDADHIAAIDNTTRKLRQEGERSLSVGLFFSLGHSVGVLALTAALAFAASATRAALPGVSSVGGTVGTLIAGAFLWTIGVLNLLTLRDVATVALRMRRGEATVSEVAGLAAGGGLLTRLGLRAAFRRIGRPWQMLPIGLVFGLGFDTASEVALLGLGAGAADHGHEKVFDARIEPERRRVHAALHMRVQPTGQSGENRRIDESQDTRLRQVDAEACGRGGPSAQRPGGFLSPLISGGANRAQRSSFGRAIADCRSGQVRRGAARKHG